MSVRATRRKLDQVRTVSCSNVVSNVDLFKRQTYSIHFCNVHARLKLCAVVHGAPFHSCTSFAWPCYRLLCRLVTAWAKAYGRSFSITLPCSPRGPQHSCSTNLSMRVFVAGLHSEAPRTCERIIAICATHYVLCISSKFFCSYAFPHHLRRTVPQY